MRLRTIFFACDRERADVIIIHAVVTKKKNAVQSWRGEGVLFSSSFLHSRSRENKQSGKKAGMTDGGESFFLSSFFGLFFEENPLRTSTSTSTTTQQVTVLQPVVVTKHKNKIQTTRNQKTKPNQTKPKLQTT